MIYVTSLHKKVIPNFESATNIATVGKIAEIGISISDKPDPCHAVTQTLEACLK